MRAAAAKPDPGDFGPSVEFAHSNLHTVQQKIDQASSHADVDVLNPAARMKFIKRLLLRFSRLFLSRQAAFNLAVLDAIREINHQTATIQSSSDQTRRADAIRHANWNLRLDEVSKRLGQGLDGFNADIAAVSEQVKAVHARAEELAVTMHAREEALASERDRADLYARETRNELDLLLKTVDVLVADLRRSGSPPDQEKLDSLSKLSSNLEESLYEAFENEFRGSQQLISDHLAAYLEDLSDLRGGSTPAIDLGSGRGEFLRLLRDNDIPCFGVDINERFAKAASQDGLDIKVGDALDILRSLEPRSVGAVTSFQLIEHLEVNEIAILIEAAFRVLVPGGVLILETPNSSNLRVGASTFYRDPTHVRSVHPDLLNFLVRHHGYVGVEARFSSPLAEYEDAIFPELADSGNTTWNFIQDLRWAIYGPQDYAVIGRKPRSNSL